jgi:imidazolonepropionase-like amidohydrolase
VPQTLFTNANVVLDGLAELRPAFNVLVKDRRIVAVSQKPVDVRDAAVIDVGGRTLMPGLIDAHAHITGLSLTPKNISYPAAEIAIASANYLRNCLMDGYTTIREAGGADHAAARLLAEGHIIGPRLYYSGGPASCARRRRPMPSC